MTHALEFKWLKFSDFKRFGGAHRVSLSLPAGLYFWTGKNKVHPEMGANGVGKSTIFDALCWCLWGKTVKDPRPANAVAPWDDKKASPFVTLRFVRDGQTITLSRTRNPNGLTVQDDKGLREITQDDVPAILGMNEETFRRTILIGQFGTMFLDMKPEQQSAMFSEALDLDRWLLASKAASQAAGEWSAKLGDRQTKKATLQARLDELRGQRDEAKDDSESWVKNHDEVLAKRQSDLADAKTVLTKLDANPVGTPQTVKKLRADLSAKKDEYAAVQQAVRAADRNLTTAKGILAAHQADLVLLEKALKRLTDAGKDKTCPTCGQKVTGKHLADEVSMAERHFAAKGVKIIDAEDLVSKAKKALRLTEAASNTMNEEVSAIEKEIRDAETEYSDWVTERAEAEAEVERARDRLRDVKAEENPHTDPLNRLRERITNIKADSEKNDEALAQAMLKSGQYLYWVKAFKEIRLSLIDEVLQELAIASQQHAEKLGLVGWDIKFQTERETKGGNVSYGFSVLLYPPGQTEPVRWESYSGGEDRRWQLAVTFGLSEILLARAGLTSSLEVLDEPAQHMSAEGVEALLECLSERAKEQKKTIFYVDHVSLDRGWFDGVFTVVRDKEGSKVVTQ